MSERCSDLVRIVILKDIAWNNIFEQDNLITGHHVCIHEYEIKGYGKYLRCPLGIRKLLNSMTW